MRDLSAFDFGKLVDELQFMVNSRMDKFFQSSKKDLILQVHVPSRGKQLLRVVVPSFLCITSSKPPIMERPSGFCIFLRKRLSGSFIRGVELVGSERIVKIVFESKDGFFDLFFEFFDKGNIILCQDNKILGVSEQQKWKDRTLAKGVDYVYPKKDFDSFSMSKVDFCTVFEKSKNNIGKTLAVDIGLGGLYSQELCLMADLDKSSSLKEVACDLMYDKFQEFISKPSSPQIILKDDKIKDIVPFDLLLYKDFEIKPFSTFNEAVDSVFKVEISPTSRSKAVDRIQRVIDSQSESIAVLEKDVEENQKKGELLYENYQVVEDILKTLKGVWKEKSLKEIKEKLKDHKIIKDVNKNGEVIVEL